MEIDTTQLRIRDAYALLTSVVVPRPIAWISTQDEKGHVNLAPFSYFAGLGSDPPMVTVAISNRADGSEKDTLRLVRQTGVFCINLVEEEAVEPMNASSGDYGPSVSEAQVLAIPTVPCAGISGVRVAAARTALECRLVDVHAYGRRLKTNLVVAEVSHAFVDDEVAKISGFGPDPEKVKPVARLGGTQYATLGRRFSLDRPKIQ